MIVYILKYITFILKSNLIFPLPAGYPETDFLKDIIHISSVYLTAWLPFFLKKKKNQLPPPNRSL